MSSPTPHPLLAEANRASFIFGFRLAVPPENPDVLSERAQDHQRWLNALTWPDLWPRLSASRAPGDVSKAGEMAVWQPVDRKEARDSLHQDLMLAVDRILHGDLSDEPTGREQERCRLRQYLTRACDCIVHACATKATDQQHAPYRGDRPMRLNAGVLGKCFLMPPGMAARRRLADQGVSAEQIENLAAKFEEVTLYRPASGLLLLVIGLRFLDLATAEAAVPLALIEEALYGLGHAADRGQMLRGVATDSRACLEDLAAGDLAVIDEKQGFGLRKARPEELTQPASNGPLVPRRVVRSVTKWTEKQLVVFESAEGEFGLHALARALVGYLPPPKGAAPQSKESHDSPAVPSVETPGGYTHLVELGPREHGRAFTFVAVQCECSATPAALETAAYRLSRRFTLDYNLAADDVANGVVRTFENVLHAMATQGVEVRNN